DDVVNIDRGMKWGFGWEQGPFETWDALGVAATVEKMKELGAAPAAWVGEMLAAGRASFYQDGSYWDVRSESAKPVPVGERVVDLRKYRKAGGVVVENDGATLYDMGDRIACLELHTKMNALDTDVIAMFHKAVDAAEKLFDGLIVGNHAPDAFSAGANAFLV